MLAHAKEVDAQRIGELGFGDDVADDLRLREQPAIGIDGDVAEGVEAEFERGWGGGGGGGGVHWPKTTLPTAYHYSVNA